MSKPPQLGAPMQKKIKGLCISFYFYVYYVFDLPCLRTMCVFIVPHKVKQKKVVGKRKQLQKKVKR